MKINEIVKKYVDLGHSFRNAQNLAAEEIILTKIAFSPLSSHVTLKGGIVMYNLTKSDRRVTQDIDFDFIRYSIDDLSIKLFIEKLNLTADGINVSITGNIEKLHQDDYQGVRVFAKLSDGIDSLKIKLDIGVHAYLSIEQNSLAFSFESNSESISMMVNPCEQIAAEKLLSLARFGALSTRFKDIYDLYFFINNNMLSLNKTRTILEMFLKESKRKPNNITDLINSISDTMDNNVFTNEASKPTYQWIDADFEIVKKTIMSFVEKL